MCPSDEIKAKRISRRRNLVSSETTMKKKKRDNLGPEVRQLSAIETLEVVKVSYTEAK